jgi:hypothetical protein
VELRQSINNLAGRLLRIDGHARLGYVGFKPALPNLMDMERITDSTKPARLLHELAELGRTTIRPLSCRLVAKAGEQGFENALENIWSKAWTADSA